MTYQTMPAILASLIALAAPIACDGDGDGASKAPPTSAVLADPAHAIHVLVGDSQTKQRYDFLPVAEASALDTPEEHASNSSVQPEGTIITPGGAVDVPNNGNMDAAGNYPAWALLLGAGYQCGFTRAPPIIPPWSAQGSWYIFPQAPTSCDETLQDEETLLCVADKLAEVADTVSPITWTKVIPNVVPGIPGGQWTIPPQSDRDKFISRDLALNVLGHIPRLDGMPPPGTPDGVSTCSELYGQALSTSFANTNVTVLFGVVSGSPPRYPPSTTVISPSTTMDGIIGDRFLFESHLLRAAGRMVHDLVRESVFADLAGAERRHAHALDLLKGNDTAWGLSEDGPYDSLTHAVRVIAGRWEMGAASPDPACGGLSALQLLNGALQDAATRRGDRPILTQGQARATELASRSGIVLGSQSIQRISDDQVHALFSDELRAQAASNAGTSLDDAGAPPPDGGALELQSEAIAQSIGAISASDLRFGLDKVLRTYSLLEAVEFNPRAMSVDQPVSGLIASPTPPASVSALHGLVVQEGLPPDLVPTDPMARVGGIIEASECDEEGGYAEATGADNLTTWPTTTPPQYQTQRASLGDAFGIGQAAHRRLVVLAQQPMRGTNGSKISLSPPVALTVATAGLAELRAWAGPGRVVATAAQVTSNVATQIQLEVSGFKPADWGVSTVAEMQQQISLVYGPAWAAECAARLRTQCPTNFVSDYVMRPTAATLYDESSPNFPKTRAGVVNTWGQFVFDTTKGSAPPRFAPPIVGSMWNRSGSHLYVVIDNDPVAKGSRGSILGTVALRTQNGSTSFVVSSMQRELLADVIGMNPTSQPVSLTPTSLGQSPSYCVDGVPRDVFVPLENELTSDSSEPYENSWKHYLSLAKDAATRADALGKELVELGLQKDLRREGAAERLGSICGDMAAMGQISFDTSGKVLPDSLDNNLKECLGEDRKDVVFLSQDPTPKDDAGKRALLTSMLGCPGKGPTDLCNKLADPKTNVATMIGALNLAPPINTTKVSNACDPIVAATQTALTGFDDGAFAAALAAAWGSPTGLKTALGLLRLVIDGNDDWDVMSAGSLIMSSRTGNGVWPACLGTMSCDFANNPLQAHLNSLFRRCPNTVDAQKASLGQCDAGGTDTARAELNSLLWRVEGAIWTLGGIAGNVPQGVFSTPIPVVDFGSPSWGSTPATSRTAILPAIHAASVFTTDPINAGAFLLTNSSLGDVRGLGPVIPVSSAFTQRSFQSIAFENPDWIADVYGRDFAHYYHAFGENEETGEYPTIRTFFLQRYGEDGGIYQVGMNDNEISRVIRGMRGLRCPQLYGAPTAPGSWSSDDIADFVSLVKTHIKGSLGGNDQLMSIGGVYEGAFINSGDASCSLRPSLPPADYTSPPAIDCRSMKTSQSEADGPYDGASVHPVNMRVPAFLNSGFVNGACGGVAQFTEALAMACVATVDHSAGVLTVSPPPLNTEGDLLLLEQWLRQLGEAARAQLQRIYLTNVPSRVVEDFVGTSVGTGSNRGSHGQTVLMIETDLEKISSSWKGLQLDLALLADAIQGARFAIAKAKLNDDKELLNITLARIRVYADMATTMSNALKSAASEVFMSLDTSVYTAPYLIQGDLAELDAMQGLQAVADETQFNDMMTVLTTLKSESTKSWGDVEDKLGTIRRGTAETLSHLSQLDGLMEEANYEVAKASGADYAMIGDHPQFLPVNTVLRREYDATRRRYQEALKEAKALAYIARRAIEQRIGVPLASISARIGPLDPPASWADDVCHLQGVDYEALRTALGPDAGATAAAVYDKQTIDEFADAFVGDYVAKLGDFIEFYNIQYPSHDGDDTAVLSLKDDLLDPSSTCVEISRNLLYYSGHLENVGGGVHGSLEGQWALHACPTNSGTCLAVLPGASLAAPTDLPPGVARGAATWLVDQAQPSGSDGGAAPDPGGPDAGDAGGAEVPPGLVSQTLHLDAGTYALSWWDQARDANGGMGASGAAYRVALYDEQWRSVAAVAPVPFVATNGRYWGERQVLAVPPLTAGTYHVAFGASVIGGAAGSVAIANVQLERVQSGGGPTTYEATGGSRTLLSNSCPPRSSTELRNAFERRCDSGGDCYYELMKPLVINTGLLGAPSASLRQKLAAGNFNFRTISVALNLVGTGVHACDSSAGPECFANAYTQYSLVHDATSAGILDWNGDVHVFDFAMAEIDHAKALSAERYITVPMSGADQALVSQPGILKTELLGRPLDGGYRVRVWDSPALHWDRLDDIQVVLNYRYWARIVQ